MKRKTPIHHTVKSHNREGRPVKSFERGRGTRSRQRSVVKSKTTLGGMSVNYYTTKDVKVKEAIWDNYFVRGVENRKDITKEKIEEDLEWNLKSYEEYKKRRKLSPTLRGMKKLCRRNIRQLKYLLKMIDKGVRQ